MGARAGIRLRWGRVHKGGGECRAHGTESSRGVVVPGAEDGRKDGRGNAVCDEQWSHGRGRCCGWETVFRKLIHDRWEGGVVCKKLGPC